MPNWVWWLLALVVVDVAIYAALRAAGRADDESEKWLAERIKGARERA